MNYKIYCLIDPETNIPRYIGFTSVPLKERLRCHLKDINRKSIHCHRNKWLRALNQPPEIRLLIDNLSKEQAIEWEILLIKEFKTRFRFTNNTDGGEGGPGYKFSKEKREELANRIRGRKFKPCSEERKRKISEANKGRKLTDEQRARMSAGIKKRFENPEERKRLSLINKGKKFSEETKRKMSNARKKEWDSGIRNTKNWKWTEERKKRMSEMFSGSGNPAYGKSYKK